MTQEYNNIEVTPEEAEALQDFTLETTESPADDNASETVEETVEESVETEETTEPTTEETSEEVTEAVVDGLELDGKNYSLDEIKAWRDDSTNKINWQKSNTEKAQELAKWNKLTDKIKSDEGFRNHLKDFYYDDPEAVKALGLDNINSEEVAEPAPVDDNVELRLNALEQMEGARLMEQRVDQLDNVLADLEKTNPDYLGDQDKVSEFLDFADTNSEKFVENGMPNLERAFKEWSYGQMQEELTHFKKLDENNKRNTGVINTSEAGAKEVKSSDKITNWKNVSMDNPDIAKYFEK